MEFDESGRKGDAPPGNLSQLLSIASLNKYSPSLTAQQMGISQASRENMANKYERATFNKFLGVTVGNQIWLTTNAFNLASGLFTPKTDVPGLIVHELFHVAGIPDVRFLNDKIQEHCGWGGFISDSP